MVVSGSIGRTGIILLMLVIFGKDLLGQKSPFDPGVSGQAALIQEQVDAFTDRSLYIAGESISFRAHILCSGLPEKKEWSTILYVELLSASASSEAQGKFWIHDQVSAGEIAIPADILTGNYFLKCYTRWMRNRDPEAYCYIPLRIINPYRPELSVGIPPGNEVDHRPSRSVRENVLKISEPSPAYLRGDSVFLDLILSGMDASGKAEGCLTVVPEEFKPQRQIRLTGTRTERSDDFRLQFLPDQSGATLSGTVLNPDLEDQIVQDARIHFTLMGDQSAYFVARSDAYGKFSVTLPNREGKLELLVQPENHGDASMEVRIDQDFDHREVSLPAGPFRLTQKEKQWVLAMARKVQLRSIYSTTDSLQVSRIPGNQVPFYGSPTFSLHMDDYVLLPTLEEVLINLVPGVTPVTRKKRTSLLIESINPTLTMFAPLIMIDQVPFFNMEKFMTVSTERISTIDVVNEIYLKGDLRFGGIVNLLSKEKDMAGIDLPGNSFFFDFQAMYPSHSEILEIVSNKDQIPDTRNTLLWIPELQVDKGTPSTISFIAPDYPGEYVVLFRGVDEQGELMEVETTILVK
jgi:hypothetical protein